MADRLHPARRIWGVCHPNIHYFQNLTPGWVSFNGEKPKIAIVPRSLHRLIYGSDKRATPPLDDDLVVNLCTSEHLLVHHPMLEGILLSECERLRQRSLANKLISLFRQFGGTELRLKLVWLCWLDLMTGNSLDDWTENLKRKSEKELGEWIIDRQKQNAALTDLMDQYVLWHTAQRLTVTVTDAGCFRKVRQNTEMMIPPALHAHLQSVFVVIILSHDGCLKGILSLLSWHAAVHASPW